MKNIFKKNQFVILVIALMLVAAGYLNYNANVEENLVQISSEVAINSAVENDIQIEKNTIINETVEESLEENKVIETSGKVKESIDTYFVNSKLQRDTMYSQMIESYQKILESSTISSEQKSIATEEIKNINNIKNAIMICENLIQTKGFTESVILVNDQSINVIIKAEELEKEQVAQIQNVIAREMNADIENIHISNKI